MRFVTINPGDGFADSELQEAIFESRRMRRQTSVAIMSDQESVNFLQGLDFERLSPEKDYRWSGWLVQERIRRPSKRVVVGKYDDWFRWYMRFQRFRAFQILVLVEPETAVGDRRAGGYIDGLLVRLSDKVRHIVVASRGISVGQVADEPRTKEVIRALLYGTRLTRPELLKQAKRTFVPIPDEVLARTFDGFRWRISSEHPRYRLRDSDEQLLQAMVAEPPSDYDSRQPDRIEQPFTRNRRFRPVANVRDEMIAERILEDAEQFGWVTVPFESRKISEWLHALSELQDSRLKKIQQSLGYMPDEQWVSLLAPPKNQIRRVVEQLATGHSLTKRVWYREIGRPALAYALPGRIPFLERSCGQCAFYAGARRRCRLWWLVNKKQAFFDQRWKRPGSPVTTFEIHKMRYASRIGPHSSACARFLDKKRDHLRNTVPEKCGICGEEIRFPAGVSATCPNCGTRYVRSRDRVRVMTAYEHEYNRLYHEITGADARADLRVWKSDIAKRLSEGKWQDEEDLDALAEKPETVEVEPPRVWLQFNESLQEKVDRLTQMTDMDRQISAAMAQSALSATRRMAAFARLSETDVNSFVVQQTRYASRIESADSGRLLPYEALIMRQYWRCFGLVLRSSRQWFGPRKRSRFVAEFVRNPAGRARGYSPVDAAINYLHQRRLRQAERINAEVGFSGMCDGFLHRERYNSRKIGLLLDMIDPFKFADREELLLTLMSEGLTWRDFAMETDRRGSSFYYPTSHGQRVLDSIGEGADNLIVTYQGRQMRLSEAFKEFASNLLQALEVQSRQSTAFEPFVFA